MSARAPAGIAVVSLALALASCAPMPPPGEPSAPPQSTPAPSPTPSAPSTPTPTPSRPTPPRTWRQEPSIDVGLAWDLDTVVLEPAAAASAWLERGGDDGNRVGVGTDRVRVRRGPDGFEVTRLGADGAARDVEPGWRLGIGDTLTLAAASAGGHGRDASFVPAFRTRWQGKTWRGHPRVFVNPRGRLTVSLRLPLETYLLGVVPGEIGGLAADLIEAGRAQAIAARSYTLYYYGRRATEGFDLYGTVEDQVYGPVEGERPLATRCVETTRGQVARYGGEPIRANYYSTCGGVSADAWEGWPVSGFPYLKSTRDRGPNGDWCATSPQHRWREEWTAADFLTILARFGPPEGVAMPDGGLGQLVDVRVDARSRSARVWRLRVRTTTGDVVVPAHVLRRVIRRPGAASSLLRSNLFKIDVRRDPRTRRAQAVVASGAGFGHGVGLCQTGALGMARGGRKGEKILEHYYPGASLDRLY